MSYVKVKVQTTFNVLDATPQAASPLIVPTKIYRPRPEDVGKCAYGGVLVCWLNESQLGDRPLDVILQVYTCLFSDEARRRVQVAVLGPSHSGMLRKMIEEDAARNRTDGAVGFPENSTMFSPRATVGNDELRSGKDGSATNKTPQLENYGLALARCIGTDRQLVESLVEELQYRWPACGAIENLHRIRSTT